MSDPVKTVSVDWIHAVVSYFAVPEVAGVVTIVGTLASVVGLGFTLWVLYSVRTLRTHFLFTARVPQIVQALQSNASTISQAMPDYDASAHLVEVEMAKCL